MKPSQLLLPAFVLFMLLILVYASFTLGFQRGLKADGKEHYTCVLKQLPSPITK